MDVCGRAGGGRTHTGSRRGLRLRGYGVDNPNAEACNEAVIPSLSTLFIASSPYCSKLPGQVVIVANWFWFFVFIALRGPLFSHPAPEGRTLRRPTKSDRKGSKGTASRCIRSRTLRTATKSEACEGEAPHHTHES